MKESFLFFKNRLSKNLSRYFFIGILSLIIIICLLFIYIDMKDEPIKDYSCGDGTLNGECSVNRPYFCQKNLLIKNPLECGCPSELFLQGERCLSDIYTGQNISKLKYIIDGKENYISFITYEGVYDYISEIPKYLTYKDGEEPNRADFKSMKLNIESQREYLIPLVVSIQNLAPWSKDKQAQIAVSLVQNIPYGETDPVAIFMGLGRARISGHLYQTIYEYEGSCEEKSELLAFLLKELGFEVALIYYQLENHEAVGIKCPIKYSLNNTGYCFVETTLTGPISYSEGRYLGIGGSLKLGPYTEIIQVSKGIGLGNNLDDYKDARDLKRLVDKVDEKGYLNFFEKRRLDFLREKYGLIY